MTRQRLQKKRLIRTSSGRKSSSVSLQARRGYATTKEKWPKAGWDIQRVAIAIGHPHMGSRTRQSPERLSCQAHERETLYLFGLQSGWASIAPESRTLPGQTLHAPRSTLHTRRLVWALINRLVGLGWPPLPRKVERERMGRADSRGVGHRPDEPEGAWSRGILLVSVRPSLNGERRNGIATSGHQLLS